MFPVLLFSVLLFSSSCSCSLNIILLPVFSCSPVPLPLFHDFLLCMSSCSMSSCSESSFYLSSCSLSSFSLSSCSLSSFSMSSCSKSCCCRSSCSLTYSTAPCPPALSPLAPCPPALFPSARIFFLLKTFIFSVFSLHVISFRITNFLFRLKRKKRN